MKRAAVGLLLGAAALGAAAILGAQAAAPKSPSYGLDIKIRPGADAKQYVCDAHVTDLATQQEVFSPHLEILAGKSNVASSGGEKGSPDYLLSVSIEGEGKEARYTLEIRQGETFLWSDKASVKLR
ncbi:MAG TPA: hypothetical protein VIA45_05570 [Thermoanaerobaculia bacterium]|jgi:hypothetical protein